MTDKPLLVIVGPTAVGKTGLSLQLAHDFDVEIISADSHQVYRGLDIGTAKPTSAEQAVTPHHLLDVVDPDGVLTLAQFQEQAYAAVDDIHQRGRLPVLAGGTGQWIRAVIEGWRIPRVPPDPALRAKFEAKVEAGGPQVLHDQLAAVDPQSAIKIDPRNVRRVIRALEVYHKTGIPISKHQHKHPPPYHILQVGLTMPREMLYERIDQRVDKMLEQGLLEEVHRLVEAGCGWDKPAMLGLGYRQIGQHLRGEVTEEEAVALIKRETRRFVRQQYNWFRLNDEKIYWVDVGQGLQDEYQKIKELVEALLYK